MGGEGNNSEQGTMGGRAQCFRGRPAGQRVGGPTGGAHLHNGEQVGPIKMDNRADQEALDRIVGHVGLKKQ